MADPREPDVKTALNLAVIHWRLCTNADLEAASAKLMAAGAAYLAAARTGAMPKRIYTEQLAFAAQNCSASRPHERDMAIEQLREIELLAIEEQRKERAAEKTPRPVEAKPLDPNRHDVRMGLIG